MLFPRRIGVTMTAVGVAATLALSGCSDNADNSTGAASSGHISVLASFYPLQFVAQKVGGNRVTVENLTPPAAEPHDLELSPSHVRSLGKTDLVVYLSGFQPAVDKAIEQRKPAHVVDAATAAHLEAHPNGDHTEGDGHDHGTLDPHFWLDPTRLEAVGADVANALADVDPEHASEYQARAKDLTAELTSLDTDLATGLASCRGAKLVTTHQAFGYLAEKYNLDEVGIVGIDPEADPSPARLREIRSIVEDGGVKTLYTETLLSAKVTQTLAKDLGIATATLDPLESQANTDHDYTAVMRANLTALTTGLDCS